MTLGELRAAAASSVAIDAENPWPGLSAFDEGAERFFNGRRHETAALRRLVAEGPLTILFGASGLGKTSLLQAGLFPAVRSDHLLPVLVRLDFREESAPFIGQLTRALQAALTAGGVDAPSLQNAGSLWEYLHRADLELWSSQNRLLTPLFVLDQFEEVFTLGAAHPAAIASFRTDLADLVENRLPTGLAQRVLRDEAATSQLSLDRQRYKVLLSFREDFLPAVEGWKRDIPSIVRNRLRLLPMSGDQAFDAVHKTAPHLASRDMARRVVSFVAASKTQERDPPVDVAELNVEPALLSLVCHGLNERRKEQHKPAFDEELLQGTGQAVVEDFYQNAVASLPDNVQRFITRELITESGFRKPCDLDDARKVHGIADAQLRLLEDRRLIRREWARGSERVELTHDLLTPVVREHRARQRLADRVKREQKARRRFMVIGGTLWVIAVAMAWLYFRANQEKKRAETEKTRAEDALKEAKDEKNKATLARDAAVQARIAAQEAQLLAEQSGAAARASQKVAESEARAALSHQLAGAAVNAAGENADAARLFALHAIAVTRDADGVVLPEAIDALRRVSQPPRRGMPLPGHASKVTRMVFSPDGRRLATTGEDDGLRIWDLAAQEELLAIETPECSSMEFSSNGLKITCANDGLFAQSHVFDTETGKPLLAVSTTEAMGARNRRMRQFLLSPDGERLLAGDDQQLTLFEGDSVKATISGTGAVFSPDGRLIATRAPGGPKDPVPARGSATIWDAATGTELKTLESESGIEAVVFSPDNRTVLTVARARPNGSLLWDRSTWKSAPVSLTSDRADCMVFSPDGSRVIATAPTGFHMVDSRSGREIAVVRESVSGSRQCNVLGDPRFLLMGYYSGDPPGSPWEWSVWNIASDSPKRVRSMAGALLALNADGSAGATTDQGAISVENFATTVRTALPARDARVQAAAFSPDRTRVVTAGSDQRARVWDVKAGRRLHTLIGHGGPVGAIAYSPDGKLIATVGIDRVAKLWDADSGAFLRDLTGHRSRILDVAFSPDSRRVATAGYDRTVRVWDASTGADLTASTPVQRQSAIFNAAFSADGRRLALAGLEVEIVDGRSLERIRNPPRLSGPPAGLAVSRDGKMVAAVLNDGVHLWRQGGAWEKLQRTAGAAAPMVVRIEFSRDGTRLLTPGADNTIRIWDTASGGESATLYYSGGMSDNVTIRSLAFSADEKGVIAVTDEVGIYEFPLLLDDAMREARARLGDGTLKDADCVKYLHQRSCPAQLTRPRK